MARRHRDSDVSVCAGVASDELDDSGRSDILPTEAVNGKSAGRTFGKHRIIMSQALVKLQRKGQMVIPRSLREEAGITEGTLIKVSVLEGRRFLLTPQLTVDRAVVEGPDKSRKQLLRKLADTVTELRQEAKEKGLSKMPKREINAAVASARKGLKRSVKQPAK
jgi:AbrB family looped-hinge helix DNA binding protein